MLLPRSDVSTPHSWRVSHAPWRPLRDGHIVGSDVGRARVFPRSFSGWRQFVSNESIRVRETSNHSNMAGRRRYRPFFGPGQVSRRSWVHWIWGLQWENCQRHLISYIHTYCIPYLCLDSRHAPLLLPRQQDQPPMKGNGNPGCCNGQQMQQTAPHVLQGCVRKHSCRSGSFWIVARIAGVAE